MFSARVVVPTRGDSVPILVKIVLRLFLGFPLVKTLVVRRQRLVSLLVVRVPLLGMLIVCMLADSRVMSLRSRVRSVVIEVGLLMLGLGILLVVVRLRWYR